MKNHSGGGGTMGNGYFYQTSMWQKSNTKSSTKAEVVGVDNNMNFIIWARYFLNAQSQHMSDNGAKLINNKSWILVNNDVLYQDNESAIKLEKNG